MDRTHSQVLIVSWLVVVATAGNLLRTAGPRAAPGLELAAVSLPDAGPYADEPLDREFLDTLRARDVLFRVFAGHDGEPVWLFLGYFDRQKEGSQVHSPRHCYPGSGWNIESEPGWPSPWGGAPLRALMVNDGVERRLVVYWYQMPGGTESDVLPLKVAMTRRALLRQPQEVVFVSLSTPAASGVNDALRSLSPIARDVHDEIERLYQR